METFKAEILFLMNLADALKNGDDIVDCKMTIIIKNNVPEILYKTI